MKLAIVTTHPIQYNAPWFRLLSERKKIEVKVFYTWSQSETNEKYDPGFGKKVEWDIPLLEGYDYCFVNNISDTPGSHHFKGIDTPTLNGEIEEWGAEAVLVFGWAFKSHLKCLRYFKGRIPVLFRGDSTLLDEQRGIKQIVRRLFLKYVYRFIDYALYVGENNKKYFLAHNVKESQLVFVPHAIDNKRFSENEAEENAIANEWKKELGISSDDIVLLFAGKFNRKKNPFYLVELSNKLSNKNIKFVFVGNGELEESLKEATSNDKRFIFLDFQNQKKMPIVYRLCDIFVLPSIGPGETWGLAINEAMACSKAIITTRKTGCYPDLIVEGQNGIVVSDNNIDVAVQFVIDYAGGSVSKEVIKKIDKEKVELYSFDNIVLNIEDLLNNR